MFQCVVRVLRSVADRFMRFEEYFRVSRRVFIFSAPCGVLENVSCAFVAMNPTAKAVFHPLLTVGCPADSDAAAAAGAGAFSFAFIFSLWEPQRKCVNSL